MSVFLALYMVIKEEKNQQISTIIKDNTKVPQKSSFRHLREGLQLLFFQT